MSNQRPFPNDYQRKFKKKKKNLTTKIKDLVFCQHLQTIQTSYGLSIDLGPAQG